VSRLAAICEAIGALPLPAAFVDLDAFDRNLDALVARAAPSGRPIRLATKSVRTPALLTRALDRGRGALRGLLAYSVPEAVWLADQGFSDLLVAYPTAQPAEAALAVDALLRGAALSFVVDAPEHLALWSRAAVGRGVTVPVVVDVDVSYRPLGSRLHLGVRRSPLHLVDEVVAFVEQVVATPGLRWAGLMGYEAHLAGLPDLPSTGLKGQALRLALAQFKRLAGAEVRRQRAALVAALTERGLAPALFNGGGTGSLDFSAWDPALTEVTIGSGLLDSHLFDGYAGLVLEPAIFFALSVTRRPAEGFVTCQSGGFIASGNPGHDRLPLPVYPEGLALLDAEGAGEVQTPLAVPPGGTLGIGAPVLFRPAKAGELAAHFDRYHLVRGGRLEGEALTYRGAGRAFY
jgi:D-serine deaminase-like pyridoxal phosphate-dependent protein